VRVVIAEDLALLRDGLTRLLQAHQIDVVAAVETPVELAAALEAPVDLAIVDVRLPPTYTNEGLVAAIEARTRHPGQPVLVLSQYVEQLYARELLASGQGGIGYLLKDRVTDINSFVQTVHQVAAGGTALDPQVVAALMVHADRHNEMRRLTPREKQVLALMAQGRSNNAIATHLVVTEKGIGKHINNIFAKLDLPQAVDDNRRVLAVLTYLQHQPNPS
jgi:DNA-binding NarL/FixJ family response regulator